ncbi:unnamed protein product, partial [Brassica oleracea var. botrytis]
WNCKDRDNFRPTRSFSIFSNTHITVSLQNDYLFFNCDPEKVIVKPKPLFCERFPDKCDSSCDSSSYLCRHLPECGSVLGSRRKAGAGNGPYDQVPEYGIRVDYEFPVTMKCLLCQETTKGEGNATTYCKDPNLIKHKRIGAVAGTVTAVSAGRAIGVGGGIFCNENRIF